MIEEALKYYNFQDPKVTLIGHNENMTYKVMDSARNYLLRIHRAAEGLDFPFNLAKYQDLRKLMIEKKF